MGGKNCRCNRDSDGMSEVNLAETITARSASELSQQTPSFRKDRNQPRRKSEPGEASKFQKQRLSDPFNKSHSSQKEDSSSENTDNSDSSDSSNEELSAFLEYPKPIKQTEKIRTSLVTGRAVPARKSKLSQHPTGF